MGTSAVSSRAEVESFDRLRPRLAELADALPPWLDPHSVALRALLVADGLAQPDAWRKLATVAEAGVFDIACVEDLRAVARAVLFILFKLDDGEGSRAGSMPDVLRDEALACHATMSDIVEARLFDSDDAQLWLEVTRQRSDDVDLMFDLRALARLYVEHSETLSFACDAPVEAARARELADLVEAALFAARVGSEWYAWQARGWTLLVTLFEEVCRVGRFVLPGVPGLSFPSLATLARAQRRKHRSSEAAGTAGRAESSAARRSLGPPPLPIPGGDPSSSAPVRLPISDPEPHAKQGPTVASASEVEVPASSREVTPPASEPAPPSGLVRADKRHDVELEVSIWSDSNFYVGFTENLSGGGVFVATHILRPLGSRIDLSVRFPSRAEPLRLHGDVRWIREYSASSDAWPGMGIRFDTLTPEGETLIRDFLRVREPLFFVE
jgi:uncharacterized protein (TIGR02266 family)